MNALDLSRQLTEEPIRIRKERPEMEEGPDIVTPQLPQEELKAAAQEARSLPAPESEVGFLSIGPKINVTPELEQEWKSFREDAQGNPTKEFLGIQATGEKNEAIRSGTYVPPEVHAAVVKPLEDTRNYMKIADDELRRVQDSIAEKRLAVMSKRIFAGTEEGQTYLKMLQIQEQQALAAHKADTSSLGGDAYNRIPSGYRGTLNRLLSTEGLSDREAVDLAADHYTIDSSTKSFLKNFIPAENREEAEALIYGNVKKNDKGETMRDPASGDPIRDDRGAVKRNELGVYGYTISKEDLESTLKVIAGRFAPVSGRRSSTGSAAGGSGDTELDRMKAIKALSETKAEIDEKVTDPFLKSMAETDFERAKDALVFGAEIRDPKTRAAMYDKASQGMDAEMLTGLMETQDQEEINKLVASGRVAGIRFKDGERFLETPATEGVRPNPQFTAVFDESTGKRVLVKARPDAVKLPKGTIIGTDDGIQSIRNPKVMEASGLSAPSWWDFVPGRRIWDTVRNTGNLGKVVSAAARGAGLSEDRNQDMFGQDRSDEAWFKNYAAGRQKALSQDERKRAVKRTPME